MEFYRQIFEKSWNIIFPHTHTCVARVWQELDYRIDICRVTKGGHIEHLQGRTNLECLSLCWHAPLRRDHPGYCTADVGNPGGTYELFCTGFWQEVYKFKISENFLKFVSILLAFFSATCVNSLWVEDSVVQLHVKGLLLVAFSYSSWGNSVFEGHQLYTNWLSLCTYVTYSKRVPAHVQLLWQELDYRIDICRVTKGGHIEYL